MAHRGAGRRAGWRDCLAATALIALTVPAANAKEGVYSGALLLQDFQVCDTRPEDYRCGRAANYVKGFAKQLMQGHIGNPEHPQICLQSDVGVAELMEVVRDFLQANPERSDELALWLVRDAMIAAYPCGQR
jgi:hypothetical protein